MEILNQLQVKVRSAVQKIEELQARVHELEEIKRQYEEKMANLVKEIGEVDFSQNQALSSDNDGNGTDYQPKEII
jgi:FtsZ-binding cell division protein ZapB